VKAVLAWSWLVGLVTVVTAVFVLLHVPTAILFGGLIGALIFALTTRHHVTLPHFAFLLGQLIVGITVGAMLNLPALKAFGTHWVLILAVTVGTLAISVVAGQALRLHRGISPVTASFSMIAGGASGMTALAHDLGADDRVVTVIQYLRVLIVLLAMPAIVAIVFRTSDNADPLVQSSSDRLVAILFVVVAVPLGFLLGKLFHLPSPGVLGGLIASMALLAVPGFRDVVIPLWIQSIGYLLIGVQVGLKFTPQSLRLIARLLPTAIVLIVFVIAASAGLGAVLAATTDASGLDAYLATTPGGLYAVLATAAATGADVTFVTAVQMLRLLLVLLLAPFIAQYLSRRRDKGEPS